jgi:hypothetical protein
MKDDRLKILCPDCKKKTNHVVTCEYYIKDGIWKNDDGSIMQEDTGEDGQRYFSEDKCYQIVECQGCNEVSYRQFKVSETGISSEIFYPLREYRFREAKSFGSGFPGKIQRLYKEVILTFNSRLEVLCAAGIRAIIEGVCNEKSVDGGYVKRYDKGTGQPKKDESGEIKLERSTNLDGKIEGLVEKGILSSQNAGSLHQLRFLGNDAVHQLEKPSEDELRLAIDIIENTLESVYEISRKGDEIERQKTVRKSQSENAEN